MCDKLYSSSQSLWNHKQRCKKKDLIPIPQYSIQETPENGEDRLESIKIQSHEIDDILEKGMWKMKDEIWNYLLDFNEGRRTWKGGSLAAWDNIINEKMTHQRKKMWKKKRKMKKKRKHFVILLRKMKRGWEKRLINYLRT